MQEQIRCSRKKMQLGKKVFLGRHYVAVGSGKIQERVFYSKGGEAVVQVAQRGGGCPLLEALKARLDGPWAAELVGGSPAHGRGWGLVGFEVPSNPSHYVIL